MIRITRQFIIKCIYVLIDVIVICLSINAVAWFRRTTLPFPVDIHNLFFDPINPFRSIFLFWILVLLILINSYGLYETKREIYESIEIWRVIRSVALASLITIVAIYLTKVEGFPRSILIFGSILTALALSLWRILKRFFVEYLVRQGYNNFNVLIIGAGRVGRTLFDEIEKKPGLGLNIVGFLDDHKKNIPDQKEINILGKYSDFAKIARKEFVNKIFVTSYQDEDVFTNIMEQAKEMGIAVRVVPYGFELMTGEFFKYNIGLVPILEYSDMRIVRRQVGKRIFDLLVAIVLISLFFPVILFLAIMVKLDSPGPIFYKSKRYGRGGKIFKMLKFRSMVENADQVLDKYLDKNEADGPIFKIKRDPRITNFGKILRRYSVDELPQIINVVKGEMSLVGPRPLPIHQVEREDIRQLERLEVRPGITGLWQIRGRSDISFSRLVRWDVWYINNWSFWLDINILFQTIPVVIKGKGAY